MRDDLMFDVAVVGAGPAGLAFTRSLAGTGLSVALIEGQEQAALRDPAFDGREIALTHNSIRLLKSLGAWDRVPAEEISDLREARVLDGGSPFALTFDAGGADRLGVLIPNHLIRRALFEVVEGQAGGSVEPALVARPERVEGGSGKQSDEVEKAARLGEAGGEIVGHRHHLRFFLSS